MSKTVLCALLGREAPGLDRAPYPGELGQRILNEISAEAWQQWLAHQTMLINENRLSPRKADDRKFLENEMRKYLFEGGAEKPQGFIPVSGP
ncbi:MAG: oxidative damage protection protein [Pseudomonadota bacterium]